MQSKYQVSKKRIRDERHLTFFLDSVLWRYLGLFSNTVWLFRHPVSKHCLDYYSCWCIIYQWVSVFKKFSWAAATYWRDWNCFSFCFHSLKKKTRALSNKCIFGTGLVMDLATFFLPLVCVAVFKSVYKEAKQVEQKCINFSIQRF